MNNTYYLSIKTTSLSHYILKAIILPSRFYNKRTNDIQNKFEDYLLLSKTQYIDDSDCSIELVLTKKEIENLKEIEKNIFLFNKPLPISRIKHIYFLTDEQKELTISNINAGAGFINKEIIKVLPKTDKSMLHITKPKVEYFKYSKELESKIKDFDQKLGGVAFVRFNTNNNKYSKNYFSILSFFNKYIKEEYKENSGQKTHSKYHGAFNCEGAWNNLAPLIYESITEENVNTIAKKENIELKKDSAENFEFTKIDSDKNTKTYKLVILYTYGSGGKKRKSIDDLVSGFKSDKTLSDKEEGISLIFGINNGYSVFYNKYNEKTVKFKMNSMLDYYTVESVFQYTINDEKNCHRFDYLEKIISEKSSVANLFFETFCVLGETVITDNKTIISKIKDSANLGILNDNLVGDIETFINTLCKGRQDENTRLRNEVNRLTMEAKDNETRYQEELKNNEDEVKDLNSKIEKDNKSQPSIMQKEITNTSNHINLKTMIVKDLKKMAQQKGIKKVSKMKKDELIREIEQQGTLL